MKPKISMVTLGVSDLRRALAFYRDGLGFPTHNYAEGDDFIMFRLESSWLALHPREAILKELGVDTPGPAAFSLAHNVGSKPDVDEVYAQALAAGARPLKPPSEAFWGGYDASFADPDGFMWDITYNPFTELT